MISGERQLTLIMGSGRGAELGLIRLRIIGRLVIRLRAMTGKR